MPELAEIAGLEASRRELVDQQRDAQIVVDDLTSDQKKADFDVEQVKTRRTRDRDRIDQGLISNPKDLQNMQHELESLDRRITSLEDTELEIMEALEEGQGSLRLLTEKVDATDSRLADLAATRDARFVEIDASLGAIVTERELVVVEVPADLLALYDRLRESKGGIGAAELRARRCNGCQLTLDNAELAVIKGLPADEVVRCEECQRILVRTPESGL